MSFLCGKQTCEFQWHFLPPESSFKQKKYEWWRLGLGFLQQGITGNRSFESWAEHFVRHGHGQDEGRFDEQALLQHAATAAHAQAPSPLFPRCGELNHGVQLS
jgi:hypothetical protein